MYLHICEDSFNSLRVMRETLKQKKPGDIQRSAIKRIFSIPFPIITWTMNPKPPLRWKYSNTKAGTWVQVERNVFVLKLNKLEKFSFFRFFVIAVHVMESQLVEGRNLLFSLCCCVDFFLLWCVSLYCLLFYFVFFLLKE